MTLFHLLDSYYRDGRRRKLVRRLYLITLKILSGLFLMGYRLRKGLYKLRILKVNKVNIPVISVGNITWGGTGKTPLVIFLAEYLERKGKRACILTRGYQRKSKAQIVLTQPNLNQINWQVCGDEPYLICRSLKNSSVIINAKRAKAARWAEEYLKPDVFILDDGFQHWKLYRDLDMVLLDSQNPFGNRRLIPLGILREPLKALSRADLIVWSKADASRPTHEICAEVKYFYPGEILQSHYKFYLAKESETNQEIVLQSLRNRKLLAFCGIGSPESFFTMLEESGLKVEKKMSFPDHYSYDNFDFLTLEKEGLKIGADYLATTAKDGLKVPSNLQLKLPILIFEIEVKLIANEEILWQRLEQILQK